MSCSSSVSTPTCLLTALLAYSCALNREILVQGRMFIGEEHVCFYANILGWVTSVVISFRDIVAIDKRNTALLFPNAIQIATLHHRYFFTSFVFREQAFAKMTRVWRRTIGEKVAIVHLGI